MSTPHNAHQASLKELITGLLTLLEWQQQLVLEALARTGGDAAQTDCRASTDRQGPPLP